jgi:hypothetical protein
MSRSSAPTSGPTTLEEPADGPSTGLPDSRATVVWIDGRQAIVGHWVGYPIVAGFVADIPSRHRSTGHIRHDPAVRHGGGGVPDDRIARDRAGHVSRYLDRVADAIPPAGPILVLGPGEIGEQLGARLRAADQHANRARPIDVERSGPLTERQLVARLRVLGGSPPKRRVVSDH